MDIDDERVASTPAITLTGARVVLASTWRETASIPTLEYRLGVKIHDVTRPATAEIHVVQEY